jgi:hypothetical protein
VDRASKITFNADNTRPVVVVQQPAAGSVLVQQGPGGGFTFDVRVSVTDPNLDLDPAVTRILLDGRPISGLTVTRSGQTCSFSGAAGVSEGRHVFRVEAADSAQPQRNVTALEQEIQVDGQPPAAVLEAVLAGPGGVVTSEIPGKLLTKGAILVRGSVSDSVALQAADLMIDGVQVASTARDVNGRDISTISGSAVVQFSITTSALLDGDRLLAVRARDASLKESTSAPVAITVDNTAPAITLIQPISGTFVAGDGQDGQGVRFEVLVRDRNLYRATLTLAGRTDPLQDVVYPPSSPAGDVVSLTAMTVITLQGPTTYSVAAVDRLGNSSTATSLAFTVDTEDPTALISDISAAPGQRNVVAPPEPVGARGFTPRFARGVILVSGSIQDSLRLGQTAQLLVDGVVAGEQALDGVQTAAQVRFELNTDQLSDGVLHILRIRAIDRAGRTNNSQANPAPPAPLGGNVQERVAVDRTEPIVEFLSPVGGVLPRGSSLVVSARITDYIFFRPRPRDVLLTTDRPEVAALLPRIEDSYQQETGNLSFTVPADKLPEGPLSFSLKATDRVGLTSATQTIRIGINNNGPQIRFARPNSLERVIGNSVLTARFTLTDPTPLVSSETKVLDIAPIRVRVHELLRDRSGKYRLGRQVDEKRFADLARSTGELPPARIASGEELNLRIRIAPGQFLRDRNYILVVTAVVDDNLNSIREPELGTTPPPGSFRVFFR